MVMVMLLLILMVRVMVMETVMMAQNGDCDGNGSGDFSYHKLWSWLIVSWWVNKARLVTFDLSAVITNSECGCYHKFYYVHKRHHIIGSGKFRRFILCVNSIPLQPKLERIYAQCAWQFMSIASVSSILLRFSSICTTWHVESEVISCQ